MKSQEQMVSLTLLEFQELFETLVEDLFAGIEVKEDEFLTENQMKILDERMDFFQAFFLWGPPGIGKSAIIKQLANRLGLDYRDVRLPTLDPVDLRGLPMLDTENKQALWLPPSFLPKGNLVGSRGGILLLDEINAAATSVQAAAYQITLDKAIGEYHLPSGWIVIACGNRLGDRSVTYKIPSALANRFTHFEIRVSTKDWIVWALENKLDSFVIKFIELGMTGKSSIGVTDSSGNTKTMHKSALMNFDPKSGDIAFATPRSWQFVSNLAPLRDVSFNHYINAIKATVGNAAGSMFFAYMAFRKNLPDPEKVLEGKRFKMPTKIDAQYIMISVLIEALANNLTPGRLDNYFRSFVAQFELNNKKDLAITAGREVIVRFADDEFEDILDASQEADRWIEANDVLLGITGDF